MKLSIVLGTYNRLDQLKRCFESILRETKTPAKVYITDAGSSDGTIEYLQSIASGTVIPVFVGKKLGQAKAYNDVFNLVDTPFTCWLSDDNEVVDRGLDRAVEILEQGAGIGMVALKTKDQQGPFVGTPYIGGISAAGILNVNQGMLPTAVLRQVGGFSEEFRDYGIDPALTAEVLFAGYKIVYTRKVALYHYRNWSEDPATEDYKWLQERHKISKNLYLEKYAHVAGQSRAIRIKHSLLGLIEGVSKRVIPADKARRSEAIRTLTNILRGKYISILDPVLTAGKSYHLVQKFKLPDRGKH